MLEVDRFGKMADLKRAAQSPGHQPYERYLALVASIQMGSGCAYFWGPFWAHAKLMLSRVPADGCASSLVVGFATRALRVLKRGTECE
jgi:hypothetical protein